MTDRCAPTVLFPDAAVNFTIEAATKAHLPSIPKIELAAASMFAETDLSLHIRYRVTDRKTLAAAQREGRLWVALNAGQQVLGFAHACIIDDQAHLDEMDVHPDYGRRGIGTELVHTIERWAFGEGFDMLTLITFRHLPWNAPFYAKLGFEIVEKKMLGTEVRDLLQQEAKAGLKIANRVCMRKGTG
jgi:GNAT superfamily N-acetyltransferase